MGSDCHIHMALDGVYYKAALDAHKKKVRTDWIRTYMQAYREKGIDYLRDGGDAFGVTEAARRIAPEFGIEYRTPIFPIHKKGRYGSFIGRGFADRTEYKTLVREAEEKGADFIKIMITGIMDFDHFGRITSEALDADEIQSMIDYAHSRGFAVMAHCNGDIAAKAAINAEVDSIEHGAYFERETVDLMAKRSVIWVPTLVTIANLIQCGRYSDEVLTQIKAFQEKNIRAFAEAGGLLAVGSDAGAYRVLHGQGAKDEEQLLLSVVEDAQLLTRGNDAVRKRFKR